MSERCPLQRLDGPARAASSTGETERRTQRANRLAGPHRAARSAPVGPTPATTRRDRPTVLRSESTLGRAHRTARRTAEPQSGPHRRTHRGPHRTAKRPAQPGARARARAARIGRAHPLRSTDRERPGPRSVAARCGQSRGDCRAKCPPVPPHRLSVPRRHFTPFARAVHLENRAFSLVARGAWRLPKSSELPSSRSIPG